MFIILGHGVLGWSFCLLYHLYPVKFVSTGYFHIWLIADDKLLHRISAPVNLMLLREGANIFFLFTCYFCLMLYAMLWLRFR